MYENPGQGTWSWLDLEGNAELRRTKEGHGWEILRLENREGPVFLWNNDPGHIQVHKGRNCLLKGQSKLAAKQDI